MKSDHNDLDALRQWATPRQIEFIEGLQKFGSHRALAAALGISRGTISKSVVLLRKKAAAHGWSPEHDFNKPVPDGFKLKRHSQYYDAEGKPRGKWVIATADEQRQQEMFNAVIAAMCEDIPRMKPVSSAPAGNEKLCNLFTITDYHVGMLAWGVETGADWDLEIAETTLVAAFSHLIANSPKAKVAVVNQLGDFLHFDGLDAVTPMHKHLLDADSRFRKVVEVAVRLLRRIVDMALASHDEVILIVAEGNHDLASSVWLQTMFTALYENESRIIVNQSALPYYVHQHGNVMLGFHHGHMKKNDGLPLHFAASYPAIWGLTSKRYIHVGHRHHVEEKEHSGVKVVQHSTLAAKDAYAARGGWSSERQMLSITYHSDFGEVARSTVTPEMLV